MLNPSSPLPPAANAGPTPPCERLARPQGPGSALLRRLLPHLSRNFAAATAACAVALAPNLLGAAEFFVSPHGSDSGRGNTDAPFLTIERAQRAVRDARKKNPGETVTVWLAPGIYAPARPLVFGPDDSGRAGAPVTWRAREPGEVTLSTGRRIDPALFQPVSDPAVISRLDPAARPHVVRLDLAALGIRNIGPYPDHFANDTTLFRLFFDHTLMPNSRWPNGPQGYTTMETVLDSGDFRGGQNHGGTFRYRGDRPRRWLAALPSGGVWLRGFWRVPWVVEGLRVKTIDPAARTVTFAISTPNGIGSKYTPLVNGTRAGDGHENWFALNLIEEIDTPGEWAVDFSTNLLYFWPPQPVAGRSIVIADDRAAVVSFRDASHLILRYLDLRHSLGSGVSIEGGTAVSLAGCQIRDQGEHGVLLRGGQAHRVEGCTVSATGLSGVDLLGGERRTLTPSRHEIVNNHIHHIGLAAPVAAIVAGYGPGAGVVGTRIAHNRIHDGPSAAVRYAGNDNLIELNEVYRIGMGSSDLGAFYTNSGWTTYGNVLRHNFVHHCENAQAFYLDDGDSGDTVEGNIVFKAQSGAFVGGGHDNVFRHNVFIACERAIHIDARGTQRGYTVQDPRLGGDLQSVPYRRPPWSERHPGLVRLADRDTTLPSGVVFENTLAVDCAVGERRSGTTTQLAGVTFGPLVEGSMTLFRDPAVLDFRFVDPAAAARLLPGFPGIPFAAIGLQLDEVRRTIPERDLEQLHRESTAKQKFDSQKDVDASNRAGAAAPPTAAPPTPTPAPSVSSRENDYARDNAAAEAAVTKPTPQAARELTPRGGLPRFFAKARAGHPLTVAYFGGSITNHEGWRPQTFARLQQMVPQSRLSMVNAAVGGTGSIVGVFRADRDLITHRPDLVFIEFAVNDAGDAARRPRDVLRALEGIIRKVRLANPEADLCLVYTMQTANVDTLRSGRCQLAAALHEQVAVHYHLPSIHVGPAVVHAIDASEAVFLGKVADKAAGRDAQGRLVLTEDNTHPVIPTGHAFYADIVMRSLLTLAAAAPPAAAQPAPLPPPLLGESWERATTIPLAGHALFRGAWEKLTSGSGPACMRFGRSHYAWFPFLFRTGQPGASVTVRFRGTMIGLKGMDGPDSGIVEIRVDDRPPTLDNHFTVYNTRWFYGGASLPELPAGEHTITWTLSAEKPDKAKILSSYWRQDNDRDLRENPAKYEPTTFSVAEITLVGEILPAGE